MQRLSAITAQLRCNRLAARAHLNVIAQLSLSKIRDAVGVALSSVGELQLLLLPMYVVFVS